MGLIATSKAPNNAAPRLMRAFQIRKCLYLPFSFGKC